MEADSFPMQQWKHSAGIVSTFGDRTITLIIDGKAVMMIWIVNHDKR